MSKNKDSGIATEHFRVSFQIDPAKSNLEEREFAGMASVFGSLVDGAFQPTIIEEGAFSKTLLERNGKIPILWQHDTREPIGIPVELTENAAGLYIKGKISKTDIGDKAVTLLRDGALRGLSIGFDPIKWSMEKERETDREWDAIRHITELRLWEVSLVTFGADPLATVTEVRSIQERKQAMVDHIKAIFEDAGFRRRLWNQADLSSIEGIIEKIAELPEPLQPDEGIEPDEALEGKVISRKNKKRLKEAIEALQELLKLAEPPEDDDKSGKPPIKDKHRQALTADVELMEAELAEAEANFVQTTTT